MKRFEITLARTVTEMLLVTVDAENREEAQQKANQIASDSEDDEWERNHVGDTYEHWVDEIVNLDESSPQESPWAGY
jgi:hypothetical protein